ncbi:YqzK family protein [Cytobacillus sp. IB215316]|uniref:YqzK family protein n=1 Tax=Cytobacillus sp. IB215316 TaxID=3097354 RepID=UPI002A10A380|nr:YqzK family protein [Cytobacillus sp. IB215316]MDX8359738.1 YqzK family protein [Cytobacillus sp. IB215316]
MKWFIVFYDILKVFILFTGCTILFYFCILWINQEYQEYHRYDQPEGNAVKVVKMIENKDESWLERLKFFYLNGE